MRVILDTHPAVAAPGEVGLGELCNRLFIVLSRTLGQTSVLAGKGPPAPLQPDWWVRGKIPGVDAAVGVVTETRQLVDGLMSRYAQAVGKRLWCAKAACDLPFAELLGLVFEEARFLCLYRNGLDVAQSCLEISRYGFMRELASYVIASPLNTLAAMVTSWADKTEQLLAFEERHARRCQRVRYEDLVEEPAQVIARLLEFLQLEPVANLAEQVFLQQHHHGGGDPKIHETSEILADRVGKGATLPRARLGADLLRRVQTLHERLGYPAP